MLTEARDFFANVISKRRTVSPTSLFANIIFANVVLFKVVFANVNGCLNSHDSF